MKQFWGAALALAVGIAALPARAADPAVGEKVAGGFDFGKLRVPLPPGEWHVVQEHTGIAAVDGVPNGRFKGMTLVQYDQEHRFVASLYARTTVETGKSAEWRSHLCERTDTLYRAVLGGTPKAEDCLLINHLVRYQKTESRQQPDRDLYRWLQSNEVKVPATVLTVETRLFEGGDYLWVNYSVNPEAVDFRPSTMTNWRESEWHPNFVKEDPERREYVEHLKAWAQDGAKVYRAALRDKDRKGQVAPFPR